MVENNNLCRHWKGLNWLQIVLLGISLLLTSCQYLPYQAKPIAAEQQAQEFSQRQANGQDFQLFLLSAAVPVPEFPIQTWDRDLLSYCALFYHPDLAVARAQWRAAQASQITAGQRPELKAGSFVGRDGESPWTYGLGIDIYIETAGRREIRIDRAQNLTEAARLSMAQSAWNVRSRALRSLLQYQLNQQQSALLKQELQLRQAIVAMLEKRVDAGIASNIELNNARILLQKSEQAYGLEWGREGALRATLASDLGISLSALDNIRLPDTWPMPTLQDLADSKSLQAHALLNRLDIRAALSRYQAAEASLRLEIAKQYPDIVLSPSYVFEQGDNIWTLGINSLLTVLNRNRGLIAETTALRELEAAQFYALQTRVIRQIETQQASLFSTHDNLQRAQQLLATQTQRLQQTQKQFDSGFADRLELTGAHLEMVIAQLNQLAIRYQFQVALIELEDALQRPITGRFKLPDHLPNKGA